MGRSYAGLIHKDTDSDYGVSFPDLPGCITAGRTVEEAREMAAEALALHLETLEAYGEEIPKPSSAYTVLAHPDAHDALALYQFAVMPPYRGLKECTACHSHPVCIQPPGTGFRLKAGMTDCELRHDQLTA